MCPGRSRVGPQIPGAQAAELWRLKGFHRGVAEIGEKSALWHCHSSQTALYFFWENMWPQILAMLTHLMLGCALIYSQGSSAEV